MKENWIIAIGNSAISGVKINKFYGTEDEVKEKLLCLVKEDKDKENDETFDAGTEIVDDITVDDDGSLNAYATYSDYHIEYTAMKLTEISKLD